MGSFWDRVEWICGVGNGFKIRADISKSPITCLMFFNHLHILSVMKTQTNQTPGNASSTSHPKSQPPDLVPHAAPQS